MEVIHPQSGKAGGIFMPAKPSCNILTQMHFQVPLKSLKNQAKDGKSTDLGVRVSDALHPHRAGDPAHPTAFPHSWGLLLPHIPDSTVRLESGSWICIFVWIIYVYSQSICVKYVVYLFFRIEAV